MKLIENFLDLFRKKEFYVLDYATLNTFSIFFKHLTDVEIYKIKNVLEELEDGKINGKINDIKKENLSIENSNIYSDVNLLLEGIKEIINQDYKQTYFEAVNNNWDFLYFLTNYKPVYNNSLAICNRLSYSLDKSKGDVIYPLLVIKRSKGLYYLWNLLEDG